jgi:hypothetical protein
MVSNVPENREFQGVHTLTVYRLKETADAPDPKSQKGIDYVIYQGVPGSPNYWVTLYPWSDRLILGGVYEKGIGRSMGRF